MNSRSNEEASRPIVVSDDEARRPIVLGVENERARTDSQYGRRVEMDRSWTVYHVFTGIPALVDGKSMTGLSRGDATCGMLHLNRRGVARRAWAVAAALGHL